MENINSTSLETKAEEGELKIRLAMVEEKLDQILRTMNTIRKIIIWVVIASVILMIVPLVGLVFALPSFMSTISEYNTLLQ